MNSSRVVRWTYSICLGLCGFAMATALSAADPVGKQIYDPPVAAASGEGAAAIEGMDIPEGFQVELFAAEPHLANPVAFCIDEQGRFYVAETFRHHAGVTDTRGHMYWLDDDLACRTVADRVAMYKKHFSPEMFDSYGLEHDRVRMIVDTDGDGKADHATVFADGFHDHAAGIGAGVLARDGQVWYSCLPDLWLLKDTDGDGVADERKSLHEGYGIHVGFLGHDLHGLRFGPDGRLYFSIGDRGINIKTEGRHLFYPDTGTVLRCNPDGAELEVFATGLRNPQELAFDDFGNLFTVDNNSDSGDKARLVYIVEGGDSGWRIGFQFITSPISRGPWNAEKLWHPKFDGQAAYHLPPLTNLADGPSGLTYYPGTGLPERYRGHFFLSDFRGSTPVSGVRSFTVNPDGASFTIDDSHKFLWQILTPDVEFGDDGNMYVLNWVDGWNKTGKGRIYRVFDPETRNQPIVREVLQLTRAGFSQRPVEELQALLQHTNQRIRQAAQFELASRPAEIALPAFTGIAKTSDHLLARLHAIWGLGQVLRKTPNGAAFATLVQLTSDEDAEVRAQAAKTIGDLHGNRSAQPALVKLLSDEAPRPRFFAAIALSNMKGGVTEIAPFLRMLEENQNDDRYLRHAAVMGLAAADEALLLEQAQHNSAAVRMGILLALRRQASPQVARFLVDADPLLVVEAARAINDAPITDAFPPLADLAKTDRNDLYADDALFKRVINANFRLGAEQNAKALAELATNGELSETVREEALLALADWETPSGRDRVTGLWRPLKSRNIEPLAALIAPQLQTIINGEEPTKLKLAAIDLVGRFKITELSADVEALLQNDKTDAELRVAGLRALDALNAEGLPQAVALAIKAPQAELRSVARELLAKTEPDRAVPLLAETVTSGATSERQAALATLGQINSAAADDVLVDLLKQLQEDKLPQEIHLDLTEAAAKRENAAVAEALQKWQSAFKVDDPLAPFRVTLHGGDSRRGKDIFFQRTSVSCVRCHKIDGKGGEVGPDLTKIAEQQKREYLLQAVVDPNAVIAKGFETIILVTESGKTFAGVVKEETDQEIRLLTSDGKTVAVPVAEIEERIKGQSAMPENLYKQLSLFDLRDLVEYLAESH